MADVTFESGGTARPASSGTSKTYDLGDDLGISSYGSSFLLAFCRVGSMTTISAPTSDSGATTWIQLSQTQYGTITAGYYLIDGADVGDDQITWTHSGSSVTMVTQVHKLGNVDPVTGNWSSWAAGSYQGSDDPNTWSGAEFDITTGNDGAMGMYHIIESAGAYAQSSGYTGFSAFSGNQYYTVYSF